MQTIWHVEWYCFSPKATLVACTKIWIAICGPAGKFGNTKISFVQPSHQPALLGSPANSCFQFYTPPSSHIALQDPTDEHWTSNCQILARKKPSDLISWWSVSWRVSKTTKNHYQPYCSFLVHILQFCAQCLAALLPLEQIWIVAMKWRPVSGLQYRYDAKPDMKLLQYTNLPYVLDTRHCESMNFLASTKTHTTISYTTIVLVDHKHY